MRLIRIKRFGFLVVVVAVVATLVEVFLVGDGRWQPWCHKQIWSAIAIWRDEHHTDELPNLLGHSRESLLLIRESMGPSDAWAANYRYVPGLRKSDPGDLVLMYVAQPTRWTWHGARPNWLRERAWILVPLDFKLGMQDLGPAWPRRE